MKLHETAARFLSHQADPARQIGLGAERGMVAGFHHKIRGGAREQVRCVQPDDAHVCHVAPFDHRGGEAVSDPEPAAAQPRIVISHGPSHLEQRARRRKADQLYRRLTPCVVAKVVTNLRRPNERRSVVDDEVTFPHRGQPCHVDSLDQHLIVPGGELQLSQREIDAALVHSQSARVPYKLLVAAQHDAISLHPTALVDKGLPAHCRILARACKANCVPVVVQHLHAAARRPKAA
eukprot:6437542-Prymnesium_polylepis.1